MAQEQNKKSWVKKWRLGKKWQRGVAIVGVGVGTVGGIIGLDMLIAGNIYHPVTYLYSAASWGICQSLSQPSCFNRSKSERSAEMQELETPVLGLKGVAVSAQHEASQVGLKILREGGNAVDAAVAMGYALAVTDPCCGNLGGGGFMLIHLANGKDTFINFREKAPMAATKNMYLDKEGKVLHNKSTKGYLAVGVPGTVKGLDTALVKYGTMPRERVMAPAISLATNGFVLLEGDVNTLKVGNNKFKADPNVTAIFLKDGKTPYKVGDRLTQKELGQTLKLISLQGTDAFYKGTIAQEIVQASQRNGGILTIKDFANYTVAETQPIRCTYRGYEVISAPPPGGGTTLCEMLNILSGYPLASLGWHSSKSLHLMLSAMLYAYADRNNYLGDPQFVTNPVERLNSLDYAAKIRANIPLQRAIPPDQINTIKEPEGTNTTHYSVIDRYGNAVAVTYSLNSQFGSGLIAGSTGFFLNNEMDDFTSKPGVANGFGLVQGSANAIEPGKRPLSSMTPTIVKKNGKVIIVTGSPGGPTITTTVLEVITNFIDHGMKIDDAVNSPRFYYQSSSNLVLTEPYAMSPTTVQSLWSMGYRVVPVLRWGAAESIFVSPKTGIRSGVNDPRKSAGKAEAY